jgi:hypothetical protein
MSEQPRPPIHPKSHEAAKMMVEFFFMLPIEERPKDFPPNSTEKETIQYFAERYNEQFLTEPRPDARSSGSTKGLLVMTYSFLFEQFSCIFP